MSGTSALLLAATSSADVGLPPRQSLVSLLTTESLIFAAFSVSATLALPTRSGRSAFYAKGWFTWIAVGVLTLIAVSAAFALYATLQPAPPRGVNAWARTCGLAIGIVAQPILAFFIARAATTTRPSYDPDQEI